MQESLAELVHALSVAGGECGVACQQHRWPAAREAARQVLSAASKLHTKVTVLCSLEDDAQFVAEVDRALARERKSRPEAVEGDQPLPLGDEAPNPRRPRGTRGTS